MRQKCADGRDGERHRRDAGATNRERCGDRKQQLSVRTVFFGKHDRGAGTLPGRLGPYTVARPLMIRRMIPLCLAGVLLGAAGQTPAPATTLIRGALLIDGTGAPARRADVRIRGDRIVAVGPLTRAPGERVVDASGLALAPGFIDTHSHHDRGLDTAPDAVAMVSQGVTTIVVGQDGGGSDLAALFGGLETQPAAVNVASYAGHGAIRRTVMGKNFARRATAAEIERMKALLRREMSAGALGLSTGLEYDPGIYSTRDEVLRSRRSPAMPAVGTSATSAARTAGSGTPSTRSSRSAA